MTKENSQVCKNKDSKSSHGLPTARPNSTVVEEKKREQILKTIHHKHCIAWGKKSVPYYCLLGFCELTNPITDDHKSLDLSLRAVSWSYLLNVLSLKKKKKSRLHNEGKWKSISCFQKITLKCFSILD